ncbi:hypothetical protein JQ833_08640 [Brachyspira hyodysenteriae]|uniref:hypothetical protein n=1 Tax=Brachyspira hyodysenteriae TaxID=159 RepID=UPI001ADD64D2|nr:hypothetical protein [Brachyspira hyodysenteriae]MBT8730302.1 hypothetical protein [Brachyspira hyodysenteriae]MBT8732850.1 hypothetical protein [Brachyspira hyodysenteriae]MBT8746115.1 hypothetical protein [Brachyspira hyodysenteriae]MBT8748559.1 hypothetical protein [Brachyspira hyodysenteriae]MBT8751096.1 hypothetical protein [Brachyspira hyodysenteriae]
MKKITKLSLVIILILSANIKVFAASGLEFSVNVPLGISFGLLQGDIPMQYPITETTYFNSMKLSSAAGFDSGLHIQIGYMFDFSGFGLSLLGDLGYSFDSYILSISGSQIVYPFNIQAKGDIGLYMHSFQIGILPKFNFGSFALGIGGGVKIPFSGTIEGNADITAGSQTVKIFDYKTNYKSSDFKAPIIPYIKVTFDYSFFFDDNMAFVVGGYIGYDFGLIDDKSYTEEVRIDSFDIGAQLGFKFGARAGY